jgi:hypothetical protein
MDKRLELQAIKQNHPVVHRVVFWVVGGQNSWELGGVKMGFLRII